MEVVHLATPVGAGVSRVIASPFQFQVTGEDNLRLTTWAAEASVELTLALRFRQPAGTIQATTHRHVTNGAAFTARAEVFKLEPGFLLNADLRVTSVSSSVRRGDVFAVLDLVRGFDGPLVPLGTLIQGYVAREASLAWPGSPLAGPHEGRGRMTLWSFSEPAAASDLTMTVPAGVRWRVLSVSVRLDCDANAANRVVFLAGRTSGAAHWAGTSSLVSTANTTGSHYWYHGATGVHIAGDTHGIGPIPFDALLQAGQSMSVQVRNMQAGDAIKIPRVAVEQWLDP